MPCQASNHASGWIRLLICEKDATAFAAATLNAVANGDHHHTAVLYVKDDEDADDLLGRLNGNDAG